MTKQERDEAIAVEIPRSWTRNISPFGSPTEEFECGYWEEFECGYWAGIISRANLEFIVRRAMEMENEERLAYTQVGTLLMKKVSKRYTNVDEIISVIAEELGVSSEEKG